ncbi:MAG: mannose-1-phosphate guanylyltransferase [Bacteroidales bacterium]
MSKKDQFCVIMAGGIGSRFWPLSRSSKPKQFLDILGTGKSLLRQTYERFEKICPAENIFVVTHSEYEDLVQNQLPELDRKQILPEPMRKNTAPCIAYACFRIHKINPEAKIVVAPSDHLIIKEKEFEKTVYQGFEFVSRHNALLTLGIKPSRIETGYGYIQTANGEKFPEFPNLKKVKTFTEKPDYEMARVFYESGDFYWNAGIFFWSLPAIMQAFSKYLPDMHGLFEEREGVFGTRVEKEHLEIIYGNCPSISIDYGIMEKAENVYVICSDFGWSDLGTWGSLYEHLPHDQQGNAVSGENVMVYDVQKSIIQVEGKKLVVLQGLENYIVVDTKEALLICRKHDEQQLKQIVNDVKIEKGEEFL